MMYQYFKVMAAGIENKILQVPDTPIIPFIEGDGTGPDIWMNLQKNYELRLAAQEIGDALQKIPEHKEKVKTIRNLHR